MEKLIKRIGDTKKSRFNASRRMNRSHIASLVCISFSSLFIICINIFELLPVSSSLKSDLETYRSAASVVSVVFSSLVLVMSVIVFGLNYNVKAENFHSCGVELAEIQEEARLMQKKYGDYPYYEAKELSKKYHNILKSHNLNHRIIDHQYAIAYDEMTDKSIPEKDKKLTKYKNLQHRLWWHLSNDSSLYWLFLFIETISVAWLFWWRLRLMG